MEKQYKYMDGYPSRDLLHVYVPQNSMAPQNIHRY